MTTEYIYANPQAFQTKNEKKRDLTQMKRFKKKVETRIQGIHVRLNQIKESMCSYRLPLSTNFDILTENHFQTIRSLGGNLKVRKNFDSVQYYVEFPKSKGYFRNWSTKDLFIVFFSLLMQGACIYIFFLLYSEIDDRSSK